MGVAPLAGQGILDCMGVEVAAEHWCACVHTLLSALDCEHNVVHVGGVYVLATMDSNLELGVK